MHNSKSVRLTRFAWLSIMAAVVTITMKLGAFWLTNSVGLLSDALESLINLATAIVALVALNISVRPADEEFAYGYSKIEFFSSGFAGGMILLAAGGIAVTAIPRLINPKPLEMVGIGVAVAVFASLINLAVSLILRHASRRYRSVTLEADAHHLMSDVLTTGGVVIGLGLVTLTGWQIIDPLVALLVAGNILRTGVSLLRRSSMGLMDKALPASEVSQIQNILNSYDDQGVQFHALRTRSAATRSFVSMHILVPGKWSVQRAHRLAEEIEGEIRRELPQIVVFTHVEPLEDPASWRDSELDRL
jgi:cation diffusion facilitator family transporter